MRILMISLFIFSQLLSSEINLKQVSSLDSMEFNHSFEMAQSGDDNAMVAMGNYYLRGEVVDQDYMKAYRWYLKAFNLNNGDAYSNMGVMYRDGLGVEYNKKIAYLLFLITHVKSLGTQSTQERANSCLRRVVPFMGLDELKEVFNYTEEYINEFVKSEGKMKTIPTDLLPSENHKAIKDKDWWLPGDLDFLAKENLKEISYPQFPDPPKNYHWKKTKKVSFAALVPDNWYFAEAFDGETTAIYITENRFLGGDMFKTGITINISQNVKEKSKEDPSTLIKTFLQNYSKEVNIIKSFDKEMGPFKSTIVVSEINPGYGPKLKEHLLLIANDKSSSFYYISFHTPMEKWDINWKIVEPIISKFYLDPNV